MYIKVAVTPGAKRETLKRVGDANLAVSVKEPASHNLANRRVIELVARHFGVPAARVKIISGHHSRSKMLTVENGA